MSGGTRPRTRPLHRALLAAVVSTPLLLSAACGGTGDAESQTDPSTATSAPAASAPTPADPATPSASEDQVTAVDGVYVATVTEDEAVAAGIPRGKLVDLVGDYELDLVRGLAKMYFTHGVTVDALTGTYRVDGDTLRVADDGGVRLTFTWTRHGGTLELRLVGTSEPQARSVDELVFTSSPWDRSA